MSEARELPVPDGLDGLRADLGLARLLGLSRTAAQALIAAGDAELDGHPLGKSDSLRAGAHLSVRLAPAVERELTITPEDVPELRVVHEDADLVVVDKPVGVAAHPGVGWDGPTVLGVMAARGMPLADAGPAERPGIVSRLDVGTSGLMVVAKTPRAYGLLKRAFKTRQVDKTYHALVQGLPDPMSGTIDAPIGRRPGAEFKFAVMASGKHAVTHYDVVEAFGVATLLSIKLETGRTHQIRVHMAAIAHPCVGDPLYGADPVLAARLGLERQWLHAMGLGFIHPGTGEYVSFESRYPHDLASALAELRGEHGD